MKKQAIKLKIAPDRLISILIDEKTLKRKELIEMVKMGAGMAFKYFTLIKKATFIIEIIYSRAEFNEKIGRKTERWFMGNASEDKIMVFSPEKIEKYTSHKKKRIYSSHCA